MKKALILFFCGLLSAMIQKLEAWTVTVENLAPLAITAEVGWLRGGSDKIRIAPKEVRDINTGIAAPWQIIIKNADETVDPKPADVSLNYSSKDQPKNKKIIVRLQEGGKKNS